MRLLIACALLALVACGSTSKPGTTPPVVVVAPPPPPPFIVATAPTIGPFVTDATYLYWADDAAIYRRALGPGHEAARLFAVTGVSELAAGATELFFVDDEARVRAVPLAGGTAREVDAPTEGGPWALYAEGDTVWYAAAERLVGISPSGRRTLDIAGASTTPFAAAAGAAYVIGYDETNGVNRLERIDLATDARTTLSNADFLMDAHALAVVGDEIVVGISDGVVAIPLDGGKPHRSFYGSANELAGDAAGYAVGGYGFVVAHERKQAPHLVATASYDDSVTATDTLALAGDYVYFTSQNSVSGDITLRAAARAGGATMMRLPINSSVTAVGATDDALYAGLETEIGTALFRVGTRKTKLVSPSGWIDQLILDDEFIVASSEGILSVAERAGGELSPLGDASSSYSTPVLHKGKVYWTEGSIVRASKLPGGESVQVIDASTFDEELADVALGSVAFANDHMYFAVTYGEHLGIVQVDEQRKMEWLWTWEPDADGYRSLDPNVVAIGDKLFIHDGSYIYRIGLDGTSKRVFSGLPTRGDDTTYSITALYAAGDHLIARAYGDGDALLDISTDGGKPTNIWETTLDGGGLSYLAVAGNAVYVHVAELASIVKIPLP